MSVSRSHPRTVRHLGELALAVLSLVVVGAGLAWACTPSAQLSVGPKEARSNELVTVRGTSFPEGDVVRLRWNGPQGELLNTVSLRDDRDDFSTNVRIPADATPGPHVIIGVPSAGTRAFGGNGDAGRISIQVTAPRPSGGTPPPGRPDRPGDGRTDRPDLGRGGTSPDARDIRGRPGRGERNRPDRGRSAASPGARDTSGRGDRVPAISIPQGRSAPGLGAGRPGSPESQAPKSSGIDPSPSPGTTPGGTAPGGTASADRQAEGKSGGRNAWKGRRAGDAPSLTPDRDEEAATDPGLSPGLAIGAGLLGFGLVALFAGFAVAEVRRRRLAVSPGHRTPQ